MSKVLKACTKPKKKEGRIWFQFFFFYFLTLITLLFGIIKINKYITVILNSWCKNLVCFLFYRITCYAYEKRFLCCGNVLWNLVGFKRDLFIVFYLSNNLRTLIFLIRRESSKIKNNFLKHADNLHDNK